MSRAFFSVSVGGAKHNRLVLSAFCTVINHSDLAFLTDRDAAAAAALPSHPPPACKILRGEEETKAQATRAPTARKSRAETGGQSETTVLSAPRGDQDGELQQEGGK